MKTNKVLYDIGKENPLSLKSPVNDTSELFRVILKPNQNVTIQSVNSNLVWDVKGQGS